MAYTNIDKGSDYFETVTYTGTGAEQSISSLDFSPDLTWIKNRDTTDSHQLVDSVRGATKNLFSNLSNAEATDAQGLKSFDTNGFTIGTRLGMNTSGESYVSWSWRGSDSSASSNTDGSITSSVSANTTSGFSIVTFTGTGSTATIGHGLGALPSTVIVKCRSDGTSNWVTWHKTFTTNNDYVQINDTNGKLNFGLINNTSNTTSVFGLTGDGNVNGSGRTYVAYCFAEKKGYSKFGSYTGNGNADGTFVYTGFKPAMIIMKKSSASGNNWRIFDNKRSTSGFNVTDKALRPNTSDAEFSSNMDFVSNGVKIRNTDAETNTSGGTYIYMCFAESPFTTSTGIPTTAR